MGETSLVEKGPKGMRDFLKRFISQDDLFALVKTTTGGLLSASNLEEAVNIIDRYSDPVTLLNRKRVKKEYLVNYLHTENVPLQINSDKTCLCRRVLEHWGQTGGQNYTFHDSQQSQKFLQNASDVGNPQMGSLPLASNNIREASLFTSGLIARNHEAEAAMEIEAVEKEYKIGEKLGLQFAEWFYNRWNKLEDFAVHHFWNDCNVRIEIQQVSQPSTFHDIKESGERSCDIMTSLVRDQKLYFSPNLLDGLGVRGKINPHGLAQVLVCGLVYQNGACRGIFEQVFALLKDPNASNNFKIRFTLLRLREFNMSLTSEIRQPAIADTSLAGIIEEVSDED